MHTCSESFAKNISGTLFETQCIFANAKMITTCHNLLDMFLNPLERTAVGRSTQGTVIKCSIARFGSSLWLSDWRFFINDENTSYDSTVTPLLQDHTSQPHISHLYCRK